MKPDVRRVFCYLLRKRGCVQIERSHSEISAFIALQPPRTFYNKVFGYPADGNVSD